MIVGSGLSLGLGLPKTRLVKLEGQIGVPTFASPLIELDDDGNLVSHFKHHYASQIALWRLSAKFHQSICDCKSQPPCYFA